MVGVASQLEASSVKFAEYLQAYTAASVQLLGRWPSFVPDDAQYAETLEPGSLDVFMIGPPLPEGAERLSVEGAKAGAPGASRDLRSAAQSESASVTEEKLRETVERLSNKLRHEVSERSRANDESMRRGMQLQAVQRDNAALQETVKRQAQQLEHARTHALKLEEEMREAAKVVETADARLLRERKQRRIFQIRAEKLQQRLTPVEEEKATLVRVVHETEALLAKAKEKGSDTHGKATELAEANERLLRNAQGAAKAAAIAKEERAHAGLQLTLMADRRDELGSPSARRCGCVTWALVDTWEQSVALRAMEAGAGRHARSGRR